MTIPPNGGLETVVGNSQSTTTPFETACVDKVWPLKVKLDALGNAANISGTTALPSPRILVVGHHKAGKSSLVEALSGIRLQAGDGTQSRMPLVVNLTATKGKETKPFARIHTDKKVDTTEDTIPIQEICEKLAEYTTKVVSAGIKSKKDPLEVTVERPEQVDVTFVELPGLSLLERQKELNVEAKADAQAVVERNNLVLGMLHEHLKLPTRALLIVVTAKELFSESTRVQLFKEVESTICKRLLCVTRVEEHCADAFDTKLCGVAEALGFDLENVFLISNLRIGSGSSYLLNEARAVEQQLLNSERFQRASKTLGIGLGVQELSVRLADILLKQLNTTCEISTQSANTKLKAMECALAGLGEVVVDEHRCRLEIHSLLNRINNNLPNDLPSKLMMLKSCPVTKAREFVISVDDFAAMELKSEEKSVVVELLGKAVTIYAQFQKKENEASLYCYARVCEGLENAELHLCAEVANYENWSRSFTKLFDSSFRPCWGWPKFLSKAKIEEVAKEKLMITCSAELKSIKFPEVSLPALHASFASLLHELYDEEYFFSATMSADLKAQTDTSGCADKYLGEAATTACVKVMQRLHNTLDFVIQTFISSKYTMMKTQVEEALSRAIETTDWPDLYHLAIDVANEELEGRLKLTKEYSTLVLKWEKISMFSSCPSYAKEVERIRKKKKEQLEELSSQDQRIVELQVQMFAYWSIMKTRLIESVQLCVRSNLVYGLMEAISSSLYASLSEAEWAAFLFAPEDEATIARSTLAKKIKSIKEALAGVETVSTSQMR